jgi:hypothetical protein
MSIRIELPEDLAQDLEREAARRQISLVEMIREALHGWQANHAMAANENGLPKCYGTKDCSPGSLPNSLPASG